MKLFLKIVFFFIFFCHEECEPDIQIYRYL